MKRTFLLAVLAITINGMAQLTIPPNGGNKKAWVGERIGITDVTINYDRPAVKGREGKIFGNLVPMGFTDQVYGTSKASPWRAGANENTTIEFSTDVKINGKDLPKGKYAFFIAVGEDQCTLIFSKNSTSWGSYFYDEKEDALRVTATPVEKDESTEWLTYEFAKQTPKSADINIMWEKWQMPFTVEVDLNKTQMESFSKELRSDKGFDSKNLEQAARFSLDNNIDIEQGYQWANRAARFEPGFNSLSIKADFLEKMGKADEAAAARTSAMAVASTTDLHNYGRKLLGTKKGQQALEVFQMNYKTSPNTFTTNMGLARGYSAIADYKKALEFARKALAQAPDAANKDNTAKLITMLQEGKDIN